LTTSPIAEPLGVALPRVSSTPPHVTSAGREAADLAAAAGIELDDWQRYALDVGLAERAGGKWAALEVALIVPRQNGKTVVLLAVELAALFLFDERLILHSAHEFKTAHESFRHAVDVIDGTDFLRRRVKAVRSSHGEEGVELLDGSRLRFVARSTGSGRGFASDRVIMDEAFNLSADSIAALLPTMSARPNPQLWYASSAGKPDSLQLQRIRERGISRSPGLAYMEWSAPERADYDDPAVWAQANPALGIRISHEFVGSERQAYPDVEFARERLGIWDDPRVGAVIDPDTWSHLADRRSTMLDPVAFAVDVSVDRKRASIGVAGKRLDGRVHVEVIAADKGTGWIVDRLVELTNAHANLGVVVDAIGPAAALLPELNDKGVRSEVIGTRDYAGACGRFYDAVAQGRLRHLDSPVLNLSVNQARQRLLGDSWAWQRRDADTDITPLVAVTLAMHGLGIEPTKPRSGKVW
jgi:hypothetical protein